MIEIFQGRIGGGKTYNSVLRMAGHAAKGGHIFTNVELCWDGFYSLCEKSFKRKIVPEQIHYIEGDQIPAFHRHIQSGTMGLPVMVVIDEAHLWFNAREYAKTNKELLAFLTQSRKVSVDIIFITQASSNIDKQFRTLTQYVWAFKDLRKFISWFPFQAILCLQFDQDAQFLLKCYVLRKNKMVFKAYNTNALLRQIEFGGESLSAVVLQKVPAFWEDKRFIQYGVPGLLFVGLFVKFSLLFI